MKHLKLFKTDADYQSFVNGNTFVTPNVSAVGDVSVFYHPYVKEEISPNRIITYTATNVLNPNLTGIISHEFVDGVGTITFEEDITSLSYQAFANCSDLTSIVIPDSVTSIGGDAFMNCSNLTSVTFSSNVMLIGGFAFASVNNLTIYFNGTKNEYNSITCEPYWSWGATIARIICNDGVIEGTQLFTPSWISLDSSRIQLSVSEVKNVGFDVYDNSKNSQVITYNPVKETIPYFYYVDYDENIISVSHSDETTNVLHITGLQTGTTTIYLWAGPGEKGDICETITVTVK